MLLSVHGLIRGEELELGRDADTGGQTKYVVELARALGAHERVESVDLVTRLVRDPRVDAGYAVPAEAIAPGVRILRVPCGPDRYLAKESLWPHLDGFVDNVLHHVRAEGRAPDLLHGHYADGGYVAARLAAVLHVPMAFTGHSLGRVKRRRLLDNGMAPETIEKRYRITRRIEAEEMALDHASFVVASTSQEVEEQYELYDNYTPRRMLVIPPGVDLSRFRPPSRTDHGRSAIERTIRRFLQDPGKPMILALSRPDPRKNIATLLHAYGRSRRLREKANLVVVAGSREDIRDLDRGPREVLTEILQLVDRYDLYGSVAFPKDHRGDDVPVLYRIAARTRGVFVNPALTEPFGLTLIEAAASGLPVVATHDGGPRDVLAHCRNGVLVDPLDAEAMADALHGALADRRRWSAWARSGVRGAHRHFSWGAHVQKYERAVRAAHNRTARQRFFYSRKSRLVTADRILVADIDNTLTGDAEALQELLWKVREAGERVAFGIATGRGRDLTLRVLRQWKIPTPQLLITSVGGTIRYGRHLVEDRGWEQHIRYRWRPDALRQAMAGVPGLRLQKPEGQAPFKVSYDVDPRKVPGLAEIRRHLRQSRLHANVIFSHGAYLDLLPVRASKGSALRYFATKWDIPLERCLVAGDSGNDAEMLRGNTLGVVVGNHSEELAALRGEPRIYFARGQHARGVLEGADHYDFFGAIRIPDGETGVQA